MGVGVSPVPMVAAALAFAAVMLLARSPRRDAAPSARMCRLDLAGFHSPAEQAAFRLIHVCAIILLGAGLGLASKAGGAQGIGVAFATAGGSLGGWLIPRYWLEARCTRRRLEIVSEIPLMLDLLQISVRGGMGLPAAWVSVSDNLRGAGEALAHEMRRIDLEVSFGTGWGAALEHASTRTGVVEFRSLGSLMEQTERFGSEMSRTLQVMSDSIRDEEVQGLEERAQQASVKILFPLAAFMLPATLLLIVAPLIILLFQALARATA